MIDNFETQLRADLAGVEATPSPAVTQSAYQTHRKNKKNRRRATLAATGSAAAAVGVVAALALTSSPAPTRTAVTTTYVVDRVTSALSSTNEIAFEHEEGAVESLTWTYGNQSRALFETPSGRPVSDIVQSDADGKKTALIVDYSTRTWSSFPILPPPGEAPNGCQDFTFTPPTGDTDMSAEAWNSVVQSGLKCGVFSEVTQTDGGTSIELQDHQAAQPTTLWVNAKTYLPIRLVIAKDGTAPGHTVDFEWLAPTKANLANLATQVPAGFTQGKIAGIGDYTDIDGHWVLTIGTAS